MAMWKLASTLLLAVFPIFTVAAVPASERQALVDLFTATNGKDWKIKTNWLTGDPCDNHWYGIFCHPGGTHVSEVFPNPRHSGNNKFQGTLPASFW
jgi:hypothetical protein